MATAAMCAETPPVQSLGWFRWSEGLNQLWQIGNPFQPMAWPSRLQIGPRERAPGGRHGDYAGGISRQNVVHRIADEQGLFGPAVEPVKRYPYGLGVGLVSGRRVKTDDGLQHRRQPDERKRAIGQPLGLAGDDRELMAGAPKRPYRLHDIIVTPDEPVVVCELVFAIRRDQVVAFGDVPCIAHEHRREGDSDAARPFGIRYPRASVLLE